MAVYCCKIFNYDYDTNNVNQLEMILEEYENDGWSLYEVLYNENTYNNMISPSEFYYLKLNNLFKTGRYILIFKI